MVSSMKSILFCVILIIYLFRHNKTQQWKEQAGRQQERKAMIRILINLLENGEGIRDGWYFLFDVFLFH